MDIWIETKLVRGIVVVKATTEIQEICKRMLPRVQEHFEYLKEKEIGAAAAVGDGMIVGTLGIMSLTKVAGFYVAVRQLASGVECDYCTEEDFRKILGIYGRQL